MEAARCGNVIGHHFGFGGGRRTTSQIDGTAAGLLPDAAAFFVANMRRARAGSPPAEMSALTRSPTDVPSLVMALVAKVILALRWRIFLPLLPAGVL